MVGLAAEILDLALFRDRFPLQALAPGENLIV